MKNVDVSLGYITLNQEGSGHKQQKCVPPRRQPEWLKETLSCADWFLPRMHSFYQNGTSLASVHCTFSAQQADVIPPRAAAMVTRESAGITERRWPACLGRA